MEVPMKQLRDDAQRAFELARHAHEPPRDAKARTRSRLQARLAAGALVGAGAVASKTALGIGALGKAPTVALLLVGAASLGYGVGTFIEAPGFSVSPRPKDSGQVTFPDVRRQHPRAQPPSDDIEEQAVPSAGAPSPTRASAPVIRSAPRVASQPALVEPVASNSAGGLSVETQLIRQAHQAIVAGELGGALALLDEHARRFPAGVLTEERVATQLIAFCRLGRYSVAQAYLQQFAGRWPKSPHWARIRNACGTLDVSGQK
jgi:hypothetical protein